MRILLTLDYEVFFGRNTGTVARTILEPTEALLSVADRHGAKLVFFVDAGFILRLRTDMRKEPALRPEHDALCRQIEALARAGHEIQLHIHSHWEDTRWADGEWRMDLSRYALQAFEPGAIDDIVRRYSVTLRELAGSDHAFAYRAGGWLIQPFHRIREALLTSGVRIDSTVFVDGLANSETHRFDFRGAPARSTWRFDEDPLCEDPGGSFLEVPIASHRLSPLFYWRLALARKLGGAAHRTFGDGRALAMGHGDMLARLTAPSTSVVSMDGYKASFLGAAAARYRRDRLEDFVAIGHPKALTPYSLSRLDEFLASGAAREVCTYQAYLPLLRAPPVVLRN
jgi:hypothetical protein